MTKNQFGVFELTIPPTADGKPAIPHNSKIKVSPTPSPQHSQPPLLTPFRSPSSSPQQNGWTDSPPGSST